MLREDKIVPPLVFEDITFRAQPSGRPDPRERSSGPHKGRAEGQ